MSLRTLLKRAAISTSVAALILAAFGELRPGGAMVIMATVVLSGVARDIASYRHRA
jgi:hypothetical protein